MDRQIVINPVSAQERAVYEATSGIIFDIQRYSVHDGPGLRTNVFLKGCPLRCGWCANPESQRSQPELALRAGECMTCGQFETPCPLCWVQEAFVSPRLRAQTLGERAAVCPTGALYWIGRRLTAGEVMNEVRRDLPFYAGGGGMTLTGGEATMQSDFAEALLRLAKMEGISTALESCGHAPWPIFATLLPHLDLILYDLKHLDSAVHARFTGVGNELILDNVRRLAAAGAPLRIRVPLVPGFNADPPSLLAIIDLVSGLGSSVEGIDLLPYHTLGRTKYRALGRDYPWEVEARLRDDIVAELHWVAAERTSLPVTCGG